VKSGPRIRSAAGLASRDFGPNMTPMVDVVMVILIFFMAGSSLLGPEWFLGAKVEEETPLAQGDRPDEQTPEDDPFQLDLPPTRVRVELQRGQAGETRVVGLNLTNATIAEFAQRLDEVRESGAAPTLEIVVQPSPETPYQDVIRVYELCVGAGPRSASLARAAEE
jgi:biopolymer transport protein ExbD